MDTSLVDFASFVNMAVLTLFREGHFHLELVQGLLGSVVAKGGSIALRLHLFSPPSATLLRKNAYILIDVLIPDG